MSDLHPGQERRARDRSHGIQLRRRQHAPVEADQRRGREDFDIAGALEMYLDQITTRRGMIQLLESWVNENKDGNGQEHDDGYKQAVERAIEVMQSSPDVLTALAVLQRQRS